MKTKTTKLVVAVAVAALYTGTMNAQTVWNLGLNTVTPTQTNSIGTSSLSAPGKTTFNIITNSIKRISIDGTAANTIFHNPNGNSQLLINNDLPNEAIIQALKSNIGIYGFPGCSPNGTAGTDIYQSARNIFMQPPVNLPVPFSLGANSNVGRVFIGVAPFVPVNPGGIPKLLVQGGGTVATACGNIFNPDNIGLVSEGAFGQSITLPTANKWIALGSRPSAVLGFNSYGFRAQWNNYAADLTVLEQAVGTIKDAALTWQDGTTLTAPNTLGFNSNNGLLIQFRNGNIPSATPSNDRFTVAKYSISNGTGLLQINGNLSTGVFLSPSDSRLKKDIVNMTNSMDIINRLNPVTYNYRAEEFGEMGLPTYKQYGFIAQEMEKVLPTHVVDLNNGYKSVNYVMLIPILTKAMQETNTTLTALKQEVSTLKNENQNLLEQLDRKGILSNSDMGNTNELKNQFFQNKPNPFNDVTTISYAFKQDEAYKIIVTDLTGKKIKEYANLTGSGEVKVSKDDLPSAGIYLYSLITSGGEIAASKQLIFEK
jgi:hypothetical protein